MGVYIQCISGVEIRFKGDRSMILHTGQLLEPILLTQTSNPLLIELVQGLTFTYLEEHRNLVGNHQKPRENHRKTLNICMLKYCHVTSALCSVVCYPISGVSTVFSKVEAYFKDQQ